MQSGKRPVALTSYTLTTAEKKYSQLELDKEALAIIFGSKEIPPIYTSLGDDLS